MDMRIRDRVRFAVIFLKSLSKPTNNVTAKVRLSAEDGSYHLLVTDDSDAPQALELYG